MSYSLYRMMKVCLRNADVARCRFSLRINATAARKMDPCIRDDSYPTVFTKILSVDLLLADQTNELIKQIP